MTNRPDVDRLVSMGFEPFPCGPDKQPRVPRGVDWRLPPEGGWTWGPDDFIGIPVPQDTVIVDIDNLEEVQASNLALPRTAGQHTKSGGLHAFYRTIPGRNVPQVVKRGGIGLDTRVGGKGYIVAWQPEALVPVAEWAEAPEWVYEEVRLRPEPRAGAGPMGTRLDILSWLGTLAKNTRLSESDFRALLVSAKADGRIVDLDPRRPWTDKDLRKLAEEAAEWEPENRGSLKVRSSAERTQSAPDADEPVPSPGLPVRITDYRATVPTTIPWVVWPLVYTGGVTLLSGPAKGGKSTLMAQLQRCRETGEDFLGQPVEKGPTLLVTEEGGVAVTYKTARLSELFVYDRKASAGEKFATTLQKVADWHEANPGGIAFIDTLAIWAGIDDENDASKVTAAVAKVMNLAQLADMAVVLVHHTRKGGGRDGEAIRGSGALLATVDISAEMGYVGDSNDDKREERTERRLDIMGRVILPERIQLDFDGPSLTYSIADPRERAARKRERDEARVRERLEERAQVLPTEEPGMTSIQLAEAWGVTRDTAQDVANDLVEAGLATRGEDLPGATRPLRTYLRR